MPSETILNICNRSLGSFGARSQIQSLNEGSPEAIACNTYFNSTFTALGRTAWWNCLSGQTQLSLIAAAPGTPVNPTGSITPYPPNPWQYSYAVPGDSLRIRRMVFPRQQLQATASGGVPLFPTNNYVSSGSVRRPIIPFQVMLDQDSKGNPAEVIVTNLAGALADYTKNQPNPAFWDSLFQQAMVASLRAFLVPALALDKALMQMSIQAAEGIIAQARAADGNEGPVSQEREASWISARSGSSGPWGVGYNGPFLNYESMPWPG